MTERTWQGKAQGMTAGTAPGEVLAIVSAGVVLASLDLFVVNVALPQIARDLGTANLGELSWVLNGYAIVYASLLVFFGRLADRYRRDRGFLLGVAVFTAASAACAAAGSVGMLVGFRLVQAAGAALLTPTSLASPTTDMSRFRVSDSTGPLNQCPRGQRILALSSGPSVDVIRYRPSTSAGSPHLTEPLLSM